MPLLQFSVAPHQSAVPLLPTLFIWGDKDAAVPLESGKEACKIIPDCRIEVVKDAGHLPWLDEPERCSQLLLDFLK